jgi:hypothetical protein
MKRPHRSTHRAVWPLLAFLIGFGFVMALVLRPPPPPEAPVTQEQRR